MFRLSYLWVAPMCLFFFWSVLLGFFITDLLSVSCFLSSLKMYCLFTVNDLSSLVLSVTLIFFLSFNLNFYNFLLISFIHILCHFLQLF